MKYKGLALSAALIVSVGAVSAVALAGYQGKGHHGGWHDGGHHGNGKHHGRGHHGKMGMVHKFQRLKSLDANKDGAVTLEEALKPKLDKFAKADTNGDGFLDGNELTAGKAGKLGHRSRIMMAKLDADGDGKVTKDEFASAHHGKRGHRGMRRGRHGGGDHVMHGKHKKDDVQGNDAKSSKHSKREAMRAERFAKLDINSDGAITADEVNARDAERITWMQKKQLHVLDKDGDGKVSQDEFTARSKQRFADNDLDSDGKISATDLPPGMAERWTKSQNAKQQDVDDEPESESKSDEK